MSGYIIRRLLLVIPVLCISIFVFLIMHLTLYPARFSWENRAAF